MMTLSKIAIRRNPNYAASGTKSYIYMLRKYNIKPTLAGPYQHRVVPHSDGGSQSSIKQKDVNKHGRLTKQHADGSLGEVSSQDVQNDSLYLTKVSVGTPAQEIPVDFDTGSSDFWIWSTKLPSRIRSKAATHAIFDTGKSSTYKAMQGATWKISYGDQSSASGIVGTDTVNVGGLVIQNQAVELATQLSDEFQRDTGSGLLGLAFGTLNTVQPTPVKTPVENMIAQNDIKGDMQLFTAKLGSWRDANEPDKGESFYTFGFIDQATVTASGADIKYTPIDNSQGFWMFDSSNTTVNGRQVGAAGNKAIADTGTTLALVSDDVCKAIYAAIPGAKYSSQAQGYVFPVNTTEAQLPVVSFSAGGNNFAVQKEDLGFASAGNGMVYGGIQSRGTLDFDILGDTWLKGIYAVFDVGNLRFGAVERKETQQNLQAPPAQTN